MHTEETKEVLFAEQNGVGVITLNRPKALNALTGTMFSHMDAKLSEWEDRDDIKAVIIEGAGDRAFCAGADIRLAAELGQANSSDMVKFLGDEYRFNYKIFNYPKPYISLIDGIVMGGGVGVSIYSKYRVLTEKVVFSMPECAIGLFPDVGMGYFLSRCPDNIGKYLALTSGRIGLAGCMLTGYATHYVPSADLANLKNAIIETPDDIDNVLDKFSKEVDSSSRLLIDRESIKKCFAGSSVEEIIQNLENEKTEWADEALKAIGKMSPFSMKVSFKQQELAKNMEFADEISMEYQMGKAFSKRGDFYEGVRAMLVDRDNSPKWQPATLAEVSDSEVQECFEVSDKNDILLDI